MNKMSDKFAIKILCSTKVQPNSFGGPIRYGYQNQQFYDMARNKAVAAIKERAQLQKQVRKLEAQLAEMKSQMGAASENIGREKDAF